MAKREIICSFLIAACLNIILAVEDNDVDYQNEKDVRVVGRAYSLTGCAYESQAGYTCLSCHRALHCYIGGAAIMVDCYGLFRYCRDGHCSRKQGAKCFEDTRLTTAAPGLTNVSNLAEPPINSASENAATPELPINTASENAAVVEVPIDTISETLNVNEASAPTIEVIETN